MKNYLDLLQNTLDNGRLKGDRTGTGTISVFGTQTRYSLENNAVPIVTTKKVFTKGVIAELLWMLQGDTNINALKDNDVNIWNEWAAESGDLGPVYGKMWREYPSHQKIGMGVRYQTVDQIKDLEAELSANPQSRRHIVSAWHPGLLPNPSIAPSANASKGKQALPPCHTLFQFNCEPMTVAERLQHTKDTVIIGEVEALVDGEKIDLETLDDDSPEAATIHRQLTILSVPRYYLSCQLYQRSGDLFLGVPFNIMSYSVLTHMLAKTHNMVAKEFIHTMGDAHIYTNHIEQVKTQLKRKPRAVPTIAFSEGATFESVLDITADDMMINGYKPHPAIKAAVAV